MMVDESTVPLQRAVVGTLRPCPFCGEAATVEPSPWLAESVRVACGNEACRVQPHTEYLLVRYAGELREAWNGRAAPGAHDDSHGSRAAG
ncbi:hypothetical protein [Longimicrobium sp.]|uniref:hypothetical protein n=1 Tax=Longimicrobium sp. TaxID=2029185 RepID=UPI003B3A1EB1